MTEEELEKDVLFQIDMQLYNEFNDKLCEINEHLGDVYTYKDLQDVENAEKERERMLLRGTIKKQDTEINKLNNVIDELVGEVGFLNYETIGEWCNKDKGDKCKNCDTNNHDCIKEYFINNK